MWTDNFRKILQKYQDGTLNEQERLLVEKWLEHFQQQQDSATWSEEDLRQLKARFTAELEPTKPTVTRLRRIWPSIAAVAAVALLIGVYWYRASTPTPTSAVTEIAASEILPANDGATLTLDNGQVIELDSTNGVILVQNGDVMYQNGERLLHSDEGTITPRQLTLSTPKGRQIQLQLADGTKIWLNANSTLTYPSVFTDEHRQVQLEGEAYFEVSQQYITEQNIGQKRKPFFVLSAHQKVEVLGTRFNIKAYPTDDLSKTNLLHGSVKISNHTGDGYLLKPGYQATVNANGKLAAPSIADMDEVMAWKNNVFVFNNSSLKQIMH